MGNYINRSNLKVELGLTGSRGSSSVTFILRQAPGYIPPAWQSQLKTSFQQRLFLVYKQAGAVVDCFCGDL